VNAWRSFGSVRWTSIGPGDTLYIGSGTYDAPSLVVGASGVGGAPISIQPGRDPGHNGVVVFDYASLGSSATATGISLGTQHDVTIAGDRRWQFLNLVNSTSGTSSAVIGGQNGNSGITVTGITFANDNNPIRLTSTSGITIAHNVFRRIRGDAVIAMAGSKGHFGSSRIYDNVIGAVCHLESRGVCPGPDGIQVGSGVSISGNRFTETTTASPTSSQHPDMIQAQGDNLRIYGNTFTNVGDSDIDFDTFADSRPHDVYIYNNLFRIVTPIDAYPEYFRLYRSSGIPLQSITNFKLVNNDFIDDTGSYRVVRFDTFDGNPTASGNEIRNNIFYNSGDGTASGPVIYIDSSTGFTADSWAMDYNVYFRPRGAPHVSFEGRDYGASAWVASHEPHGRVAAPAFVAYKPGNAGNDYHLRANDRVANDAGRPESGLFSVDHDGRRRPHDARWDIGAFEGR
jgi:hypothetical protein